MHFKSEITKSDTTHLISGVTQSRNVPGPWARPARTEAFVRKQCFLCSYIWCRFTAPPRKICSVRKIVKFSLFLSRIFLVCLCVHKRTQASIGELTYARTHARTHARVGICMSYMFIIQLI